MRQNHEVELQNGAHREQLNSDLNEDIANAENEDEDPIPSESIINIPKPFFSDIPFNGQKTNFKSRVGRL